MAFQGIFFQGNFLQGIFFQGILFPRKFFSRNVISKECHFQGMLFPRKFLNFKLILSITKNIIFIDSNYDLQEIREEWWMVKGLQITQNYLICKDRKLNNFV
jgi:hypothetical protein